MISEVIIQISEFCGFNMLLRSSFYFLYRTAILSYLEQLSKRYYYPFIFSHLCEMVFSPTSVIPKDRSNCRYENKTFLPFLQDMRNNTHSRCHEILLTGFIIHYRKTLIKLLALMLEEPKSIPQIFEVIFILLVAARPVFGNHWG